MQHARNPKSIRRNLCQICLCAHKGKVVLVRPAAFEQECLHTPVLRCFYFVDQHDFRWPIARGNLLKMRIRKVDGTAKA
jgi:hypothetical protein